MRNGASESQFRLALGDKLLGFGRPAFVAAVDFLVGRLFETAPSNGLMACRMHLHIASAALPLRRYARALRLPGIIRPRFALPGA